MPKSNSLCLRATGSAYLVFTIICGIPFSIGLLALMKNPASWEVAIIPLGAWILSLVWLRSFYLSVTDNSITYSSLFHGTSTLLWTEIKRSEIIVGYPKYKDRFKPPVRLFIEPTSLEKKPLEINIKVFSKIEIEQFLDIINDRLKIL